MGNVLILGYIITSRTEICLGSLLQKADSTRSMREYIILPSYCLIISGNTIETPIDVNIHRST